MKNRLKNRYLMLPILSMLLEHRTDLFSDNNDLLEPETVNVSNYQRLRDCKGLFVLRAKTEPFDFIQEDFDILYFTVKISEATIFSKYRANEILKNNGHLYKVKISHLPIRALLKRERK